MQTQLEKDLIATRDRIARPENWMQGGAGYRPAGPFGASPAWCLNVAVMVQSRDQHLAIMSALLAVMTDDELDDAELHYRYYTGRLELVGPLKPQNLIIGFNDSHTHAEVVAKTDRAIGVEQQRQRPPKPRIAYDTTEAVAELRRKALGDAVKEPV